VTEPSPRWPTYRGPADLDHVEQVPLAGRDLPTSVYDLVRRSAQEYPDSPAHLTLRDGGSWDVPVTRTYSELHDEVTRAANAFARLGVERTTTVALLSVNTAELVPALLAAEACGIAAPLNPSLNEQDAAALLRRAGARVLVASGPELNDDEWGLARRLAVEVGVCALLALRPTGATGAAPRLEALGDTVVAHLEELAAVEPADVALFPEPDPDDLAAFFHTGGTTGTPKLAAHTHRMQLADAWAVALGTVEDPETTFFAALPLFHVNALIVTTLAPMLRGQRVVWAGPLGYRDGPLLASFWRIVERYRIYGMSGVPTVYNALANIPVDADISSLTLVIVGAAPLPRAVADRWLAHTGVPLCEGYGLTEATCASARSFPEHQRPGSVGQRLPYQDVAAVSIADSGEWTFLRPDEVGTIVIRGPVVFPGYVVARDHLGPVLDVGSKVRDDWLDTGDLGSVSADGWISLVGRAKDVIIRGGHNIDPVPIEQVLLAHPAVSDAGVVGRPDAKSGEVPVAYVVLSDAGAGSEEIRAWAATRVPEPAAAPVKVLALPMLPVTAIGKPDKLALRVLAARDELGPRLSAAGVELPDDGSWCVQRDGAVTLRLVRPEEQPALTAAEGLLAAYALAWSWTEL
jgi:fatty-acyl-CoA synthase